MSYLYEGFLSASAPISMLQSVSGLPYFLSRDLFSARKSRDMTTAATAVANVRAHEITFPIRYWGA